MPRGRHTALTIHLTAEERQTLEGWQRSTTIRAGLAQRSRLLLLLADGVTITETGRRVGLTRRFVYKWAKRFLQDGLEGLADKRGRGRRPGLTTPATCTQASRRQQGAASQQAVR